jgi:hypothetical protein
MSVQLNLENQKPIPDGVKGWNWGAFMLTWIWGICNGTLISLLALIPGVHFIMMFVLGIKGNEWAWANKNWDSVEQFHRAQRKWATWAVCLWLAAVFLFICVPFGLLGWGAWTEWPQIRAMMGDFDPHRRYCNYALGTAERDQRCNAYFGSPLQMRGPAEIAFHRDGYGEVSLPIRGPRGEGTLYLRTQRMANEWRLHRAEIETAAKERFKLATEGAQERMRESEERVANLVAATRAEKTWSQREPNGREEAEEFYQEALARIKQDPNVREFLGDNISARVENAHMNFRGPMGEADFRVALQGNGQSGLLSMQGYRSMGRWFLNGAEVQLQHRTFQFPRQEID